MQGAYVGRVGCAGRVEHVKHVGAERTGGGDRLRNPDEVRLPFIASPAWCFCPLSHIHTQEAFYRAALRVHTYALYSGARGGEGNVCRAQDGGARGPRTERLACAVDVAIVRADGGSQKGEGEENAGSRPGE